jgi:replication factor C large subunit
MKIWVEKYRPEKLRDVAGNPTSIKTIVEWSEGWREGMPKKRAILLYGPAGTGKTSVAYALARELNYDYIELNASDTRTHDVINRVVGSASSLSTLNPEYEKKVIILDEVDGIHGKSDYGGLSALKKWVRLSLQPIILIANDPWSLPRDFRSLTLMVSFKRINQRTVLKILKNICSSEGIETDEKVLKIIAANANGDLRSAINDLQALSEGKKKLSLPDIDILTMRDSEVKIFDTLIRIFKTTSCERAREAVWDSGEDPDTLLKWIVENVPREYEDPEDLAKAFNYLSRADIFKGRIIRRQDWGLLAYVTDLMSAGVAVSKKNKYKKFTRYQYPQVFALYARTKKQRAVMDSIAEKIIGRRDTTNEKTHCSKKEAKEEYIPMLRIILNNDQEMGSKLASELELTLEEIQFFVKEEALAKKIYDRSKKITAERIKGRIRKEKQASLAEF